MHYYEIPDDGQRRKFFKNNPEFTGDADYAVTVGGDGVDPGRDGRQLPDALFHAIHG